MNPTRPGAPQLLGSHHRLEAFDCVEPSLSHWLKQHAQKHQGSCASRTFAVCIEDRVVAYYCLAMGSVGLNAAPGKVKRNVPDQIPVAVVGRLAVDRTLEGRGYGTGLVKDAVQRVIQIREEIGVRALLVHAISQSAGDFYLRRGFIESPTEPMTPMLPMQDAIKTCAKVLGNG